MEVTLGHTYRWHATTAIVKSHWNLFVHNITNSYNYKIQIEPKIRQNCYLLSVWKKTYMYKKKEINIVDLKQFDIANY